MSTPRQETEKPPIIIDFLVWQKTEPHAKEVDIPLAKPIPKEKMSKPVSKPKIPDRAPLKTPPIIPEVKKQLAEKLIPRDKEIVENENKIASQEEPQIPQNTRESLPNPVPLFKVTDLPQFLHREIPDYPESMRSIGRSSIVILDVLIDTKGKVRKVTVLESGGEQFDKAAIKGMKASSFTPAKINKKTVAVLLRMPVEFRLL